MSTKPRDIIPSHFYHAYNRGAHKSAIFHIDRDYEYFLEKVLFYKVKTGVIILAYAILPNHWHFLLKEPTRRVGDPTGGGNRKSVISNFLSLISNSYTKYFNYKKEHSGRIFEGPFKLKLVDKDNYLKNLINYINLNHIKHNIRSKVNDWDYTSHHEYVYQSKFRLIDNDYLIDFKGYNSNLDFYTKKLRDLDEEF